MGDKTEPEKSTMSKKNATIEVTGTENGIQGSLQKKEVTADKLPDKHITVNLDAIEERLKELNNDGGVIYDTNHDINPGLPSAHGINANGPKQTSELEVLSLEKYDHRKMSAGELVDPREQQRSKIGQTDGKQSSVVEVIHVGGPPKEILPGGKKLPQVSEMTPKYSPESRSASQSSFHVSSGGVAVLPTSQQESTRRLRAVSENVQGNSREPKSFSTKRRVKDSDTTREQRVEFKGISDESGEKVLADTNIGHIRKDSRDESSSGKDSRRSHSYKVRIKEADNHPEIAPRSLHKADDPSSQSEEDTTSSTTEMSKSSEDLRAKQIYYKMKKEQNNPPDGGKSKKINDEDVSQNSFWPVPKPGNNQPFLNMESGLNSYIDQDGKFGVIKGKVPCDPTNCEGKSYFSWIYVLIFVLLIGIVIVVTISVVINYIKEPQIIKGYLPLGTKTK